MTMHVCSACSPAERERRGLVQPSAADLIDCPRSASAIASETRSSRRFDEKMIADVRAMRERLEKYAGHGMTAWLTVEEIDALLRAADERDALKREACAMPDEGRSFRLAPVVAIHGEFVTMRVDEWRRVTDELFRDCYGTETSLLEAMLAKLTASTFEADIPAEIRERAGEPVTDERPRCDVCSSVIVPDRFSTSGWRHEIRPMRRHVASPDRAS